MTKTIVANAKERRAAAEMVAIYSVSKLQAKMLIRRENHPVWGHDRIMVYAKMLAVYMQPCAYTNEPMEVSMPLKFKAAFREDYDEWLPMPKTQFEDELKRRGLRPDVAQGEAVEKLLREFNPVLEIPENMWVEAILDNVVDLGELVLQHFACHVDRSAGAEENSGHRFHKRMSKRLTKELGVQASFDFKEEKRPLYHQYSAQEIHDYKGSFEREQLRKEERRKRDSSTYNTR